MTIEDSDTHNSPDLRTAILKQREMLTSKIGHAMYKLSRECAVLMTNRSDLEQRLILALGEIPFCKHLYVMNADGVQIVDNVTRRGPDKAHFGRDRSMRPYMQGIVGATDFRLSEAYISKNSKRPSLTAVCVIRDTSNTRIGFLGADYDLRELPVTQDLYRETQSWRQIKGDPSIRSQLFQQSRAESQVDSRVEDVLALMTELITHHGVFHGKLHFSSSRATIWLVDDPYRYRLLSYEDLTDPNTCLAYPHQPYTKKAVVPQESIASIFEMFRELRFADENIYLRGGSINICNGMVALNFSCDGSHYIQYDEFLNNGLEFWFGLGR